MLAARSSYLLLVSRRHDADRSRHEDFCGAARSICVNVIRAAGSDRMGAQQRRAVVGTRMRGGGGGGGGQHGESC
jgi:hypothetical protein